MDIEKAHEPCDEAELIGRVRDMAYQFARRLTSDANAEDIAQDVAFDCLLKIRRNEWRVDPSLEALVASMTWRKHACRRRKEKHRRISQGQYLSERSASAPDWMHPASGAERQEVAMMRQRALEELPMLTRIAYRMVREQGATQRFTAESMGVSQGSVAFHLGRAEEHLMDRLVQMPSRNSTPSRRNSTPSK